MHQTYTVPLYFVLFRFAWNETKRKQDEKKRSGEHKIKIEQDESLRENMHGERIKDTKLTF